MSKGLVSIFAHSDLSRLTIHWLTAIRWADLPCHTCDAVNDAERQVTIIHYLIRDKWCPSLAFSVNDVNPQTRMHLKTFFIPTDPSWETHTDRSEIRRRFVDQQNQHRDQKANSDHRGEDIHHQRPLREFQGDVILFLTLVFTYAKG